MNSRFCHAGPQVKHPLRNIFSRRYRPELIMAVFIPFFQQFTGDERPVSCHPYVPADSDK